jgi:hypothetical protein
MHQLCGGEAKRVWPFCLGGMTARVMTCSGDNPAQPNPSEGPIFEHQILLTGRDYFVTIPHAVGILRAVLLQLEQHCHPTLQKQAL